MRRRWRDSWPAVAVVVCIAAIVVLCLLASTSSGAGIAASRVLGARLPGGRMLVRHGTVVAVQPAPGSLYVALQRGPSGHDLLLRLDPASGRPLARRALGAGYDASVVFGGSLWVVTTSYTRRSSSSALWRLNPGTLAVSTRLALPGSTGAINLDQPLAAVGRRLWLAYAGRLVPVDPTTGSLGAPRRIAKAQQLGIIAGPDERTILLSAATDRGRGWIQGRAAATGAFERTSGNFFGVHQPWLGGTDAGRLWIAEATGMMGYVQAVSLRTLRPARTPGLVSEGTNGIDARVAGGVLFVTDGGALGPNYCASPVGGAARSPLPAEVRGGWVAAIAQGRIYVVGRPTRGASSGPLLSVSVPAACR